MRKKSSIEVFGQKVLFYIDFLSLGIFETFLVNLVHCLAEQQQQPLVFGRKHTRALLKKQQEEKGRKHALLLHAIMRDHYFEIIVIFVVRGSLCIVNIP